MIIVLVLVLVLVLQYDANTNNITPRWGVAPGAGDRSAGGGRGPARPPFV